MNDYQQKQRSESSESTEYSIDRSSCSHHSIAGSSASSSSLHTMASEATRRLSLGAYPSAPRAAFSLMHILNSPAKETLPPKDDGNVSWEGSTCIIEPKTTVPPRVQSMLNRRNSLPPVSPLAVPVSKSKEMSSSGPKHVGNSSSTVVKTTTPFEQVAPVVATKDTTTRVVAPILQIKKVKPPASIIKPALKKRPSLLKKITPTPVIIPGIISEECGECNRGDREEKLLVCDSNCGRVYHMDCLFPVVKTVPIGDWHCPPCSVAENREQFPPGQCRVRIKKGKCLNTANVKNGYCTLHECDVPGCVNREVNNSSKCTRHCKKYY